jgi:hypothetical protein
MTSQVEAGLVTCCLQLMAAHKSELRLVMVDDFRLFVGVGCLQSEGHAIRPHEWRQDCRHTVGG